MKEIPEDYKQKFDEDIRKIIAEKQPVPNAAFYLGKYLNRWNLAKLMAMVQSFSCYFTRPYPKD